MASCGFAHLEPLPSHLTGRTLALCLDHLPGKGPLQAKRAPRPVSRDVLGLQLQQEQIGHDRHRHGALDAVSLFGHLMWPQTHDPFQFFAQQLSGKGLARIR
jgi:hypothetical protein